MEGIIMEDKEQLLTSEQEFKRKFLEDISRDDLFYVFLRSHLYIEANMNSIIENHFPNPDALELNKFRFEQKIRLLSALNKIESNRISIITKINKVRNNLAHSLEHYIDEKNIQDILAIVPKEDIEGIRDLAKLHENNIESQLKFLLVMVVAELSAIKSQKK